MNPQKDMLILRNDVFWEDLVCEPEDYACGKAELCLTEDVIKLLHKILVW